MKEEMQGNSRFVDYMQRLSLENKQASSGDRQASLENYMALFAQEEPLLERKVALFERKAALIQAIQVVFT